MSRRMGSDGAAALKETLAITCKQVEGLPDSDEKELVSDVLRELGFFLDLKCTVPGHFGQVAEQLPDSTVTAVDGEAEPRCIVAVTSSVPGDMADEMRDLLVALRSDLPMQDVAEPMLSMSTRLTLDRSNRLREHLIRALHALEGSWSAKAPEDVRRRLDQVVRHEREQLSDRHGRQMAQRVRAGVDQIEDLVHELRETVRDGKEAVAKLGEGELASDFGDLTRHEGRLSWFWQAVVGVVLVSMAWSSYELIADITDVSWTQALQKATVSLPLAALAAFAIAEARVHRHRSMWARSMAVQLRTVGAFTSILSPAERDELRMALGRRVFDAPAEPRRRRADAAPAGVGVDPAALGREITGLAEGLAQLVPLLKLTDTRPDEAATSS